MTSDTVGGVWNYSINLIRSLAPYGVEVILATMGRRPSGDQVSQASEISNLHLADTDFKLEWMDDPWSDVACAGDWLLQLEAKWQPALIHLNGYSHAVLPWRVPRLVVAHSCVLSWWEAVRRVPLPTQWQTYAAQVAKGLRTAEIVIAPTAAMLADLRRLYAWDGDGIVIWNGIAPRQSGVTSKEDLVFATGRFWDEAKNLSALEAVAPQLPWPVFAAGEAEVLQQAGAVTRLGYLPAGEVGNWMRRAAIYALPARYEPFGLSILEAALSACALVIGDIPSLRELWDGAAWFVTADDCSEVRHALTRLIEQPALRQQFARHASERARRYGAERMAEQYAAIYRKLIADRRSKCES